MVDKHQIAKNVEAMKEVNVGRDHRKVRCRVKIDTKRERRHLFHHTPEHLRVLYSTANDPETANDPQNGPQMILDRK